MRSLFLFLTLTLLQQSHSQNFNTDNTLDLNNRLSTIDFVEILNNNKQEAIYYYQNNWKILRQKAIKKNYILSYQLLETPISSDNKLQLILITTYANNEQYDKREEHFSELIKNNGALKLLNEKKPNQFRKVLFFKEPVKHLN